MKKTAFMIALKHVPVGDSERVGKEGIHAITEDVPPLLADRLVWIEVIGVAPDRCGGVVEGDIVAIAHAMKQVAFKMGSSGSLNRLLICAITGNPRLGFSAEILEHALVVDLGHIDTLRAQFCVVVLVKAVDVLGDHHVSLGGIILLWPTFKVIYSTALDTNSVVFGEWAFGIGSLPIALERMPHSD